MNSINIIGNLTADPIKGEDDGAMSAYFTVAVNRIGSENTDFFHCKAKDKQAENLLKYKKKGDKLGVSGWMLSYNKPGVVIGDKSVVFWMIAAVNIDYCDSRNAAARSNGQVQPSQPAQQGEGQAAGQGAGSFRRRGR